MIEIIIIDSINHSLFPLNQMALLRKTCAALARDGSSMWLRRSGIILQLRHKEKTDVEVLSDAILTCVDEKEFFIQKAIGWSLRQYAYTDASWVQSFVAKHQHRMSNLAVREALKHVGPGGGDKAKPKGKKKAGSGNSTTSVNSSTKRTRKSTGDSEDKGMVERPLKRRGRPKSQKEEEE